MNKARGKIMNGRHFRRFDSRSQKLVVVSYKAEPFLSFSKRSAPQIKPDMTIVPIMTQKP